ncbi:MAG: FAD:protein FMN transferase [Woeseia sp.]
MQPSLAANARGRLLPALGILLLLGACGDKLRTIELTGATMGTTYSVKLIAADEPDGLSAQIGMTLAAIDGSMSTYLPDSELSKFNADTRTSWIEVSKQLCAVIDQAQQISERSGGAFDVTVGPLVNLWGFGSAGIADQPPEQQAIIAALEMVGFRRLQTDCAMPALRKEIPGLYVDLSGYAKGYAVDQVAALLDDAGIADYLVEIGGEMRMRGANLKRDHWAIAIETPTRGERSVQTIVRLTDSAIATSGDYRNYFEYEGTAYSHTINPSTGYPVAHDAASVTVVADTTAFADGIATALLVLGPEAGLELAEREQIAAYFLLRNGDGIEERMSSLFASVVLTP